MRFKYSFHHQQQKCHGKLKLFLICIWSVNRAYDMVGNTSEVLVPRSFLQTLLLYYKVQWLNRFPMFLLLQSMLSEIEKEKRIKNNALLPICFAATLPVVSTMTRCKPDPRLSCPPLRFTMARASTFYLVSALSEIVIASRMQYH